MNRKLATLLVLCLTTGTAMAAHKQPKHAADCASLPAADRAPALRPVTQAEAKAFGERVTGYNDRRDLRALRAYRKDAQLLLLLTQVAEPSAVQLTGSELQKFLKENLVAKEDVKSATSCLYQAREDGQALESCITVNAAQRYPTYSVSLISRDKQGLHFSTTFVTDSARLAYVVSAAGKRGGTDAEAEAPDADAATEEAEQPLKSLTGPRRKLEGA